MKLSEVFGTVLPFIGWREYDEDIIDEVSEYVHGVEPTRRYSGFQIAWLGLMYCYGFKDIGPRE